jgi:hypothetical protein
VRIMPSDRQNAIAEYMTSFAHGGRVYTGYDVRVIESAISLYRVAQQKSGGKVRRLKTEFRRINQETAELSGGHSADEVRLCKRCTAMEYEERTGKAAWGFKEYRERNGFDSVSGKAI